MRIITISREFGSGGRELGKRLAELMDYDYYDKEIITAIAQNKNLDENYVSRVLDNHGWKTISLSFKNSFVSAVSSMQTSLLLEQKHVIEEIAKTGKNCVIVGRNADVLLQEYHPLNIFVCAEMSIKIERCRNFAAREETLSNKELERKIRSIDKKRSQTRELLTESKWGNPNAYHLIINTTEWNIKDFVPAVKAFADCWFQKL